MALVPTDNDKLLRDTETRALVPTNMMELERHRQHRSKDKRQYEKLYANELRFNTIHTRLERVELLLDALVRNLETLVQDKS